MKVEIPNSILHPAVSSARGVIQSSSPILAANFFLLRQTDSGVSLTASDGETEMTYLLGGIQMSEPRAALISASKLLVISTNFSEDAVISIDCSDEKALIKAGSSHFKLGTLGAEQFPLMEEQEKEQQQISLRADDLRYLIEKTDFSMAQGDARYYLNGMLLSCEGDSLLAVATDGHRMAVCKSQQKEPLAQEPNVILPRRGVLELKRLLPQSEEAVSIGIGQKQLSIRFGVVTLRLKLFEADKYPDYKRVMPSDFENSVRLETGMFRQMLARTQVVENDATQVCFGPNQLRVTSQSDQDEAETENEIEYSGKKTEIGFNRKYLLEVLNVIDSEHLLFEFKDSGSAVQLREADSEAAKYIVMPLRL